jgi:hypothetical protein
MILVKYFVPEDGDDEEHPNVFSVSAFFNSISIYYIYIVTVNLYQIRVHNERIELNLRDLKKVSLHYYDNYSYFRIINFF